MLLLIIKSTRLDKELQQARQIFENELMRKESVIVIAH
jgi:hypothetical protein